MISTIYFKVFTFFSCSNTLATITCILKFVLPCSLTCASLFVIFASCSDFCQSLPLYFRSATFLAFQNISYTCILYYQEMDATKTTSKILINLTFPSFHFSTFHFLVSTSPQTPCDLLAYSRTIYFVL